jgi:hypothetical protein
MSCVDSVTCSTLNNSTPLNSQKAPSFAAELQAAQVKISQSQTADITIVTAEGDTVTLSSSRAAELSFATYNAHGKVSGSAELHRSSAFSFSVDGELNREELKDIRRAIRTIQKAANDVLKGHEEQAASRTARLAGLDQIASIDADLEFHREVSVTRISAQSESAAIPESTDTPAQTVPAETPAATEATVSTATASSHLSVVIQTQAGSTPANGDASTKLGFWNSLYPKNDSTDSVTAPESATPVPA